jgi:hypothetical protein
VIAFACALAREAESANNAAMPTRSAMLFIAIIVQSVFDAEGSLFFNGDTVLELDAATPASVVDA